MHMPGSVDAVIAENVRALRARRRLRQEDLATELGWSRAVITTLENGTRRVTVEDAINLCRALDVSLRDLLTGLPVDDVDALDLR
jgi:transcriptional regulator with XRE-family HTH domain